MNDSVKKLLKESMWDLATCANGEPNVVPVAFKDVTPDGKMRAEEGAHMYQKKLEKDIRCPLEYGLSVFGGKWKSRIICVLAAKETLRYSELRKEMANITDAVLATTLKELIADGIIVRQSYDEIPPRVEYSLTEKGVSVVPILQSICHWSGIFYKEETDTPLSQCQRRDYR